MKTLVAGIGSPILSDDGVGVHVVRRLLEGSPRPGVDVIDVGTGGLALLDVVAGYDRLVLVDAAVTGAPPGTVHRFTGSDVTRTVHLGIGHEADLSTALALGKELMGLSMPRDVIVVAVEAADITTFSEELTPAVQAAIPAVLAAIDGLLPASNDWSNLIS